MWASLFGAIWDIFGDPNGSKNLLLEFFFYPAVNAEHLVPEYRGELEGCYEHLLRETQLGDDIN